MPARSGRRSSLTSAAAEQRGGEEAVLAVADIDQHRREGEREEEPKMDPWLSVCWEARRPAAEWPRGRE